MAGAYDNYDGWKDIKITSYKIIKKAVKSVNKDSSGNFSEAVSLNLQPSIADRFTKSQLAELTPEEIKILQEPHKNRAEVAKIIAKYNPKNKFNEAVKAKTTDKLCSVVLNGKQCFVGTKEECEKFIKDHESEEAAKERGGFKLLNTAEIYVDESLIKEDKSMPLRSIEIKDKENSKKGISWQVIYGEKDSLHKEFKNEEEAKKFAKENNGKLMPFRTTEVESLNEDLEDLEANATIVDYVEYKHSYCHALEPNLKKINYYANVLKKPVNYIKAMVKGIIKNSPEVRWTDKEQWFMDKLNEFWPDSYELYKFIKNSIKKAHDTWVYVDADGELIPELNKDMISLPVNESLTEEGDLNRLLDSDEFKTPVSEEEINAARREVAKESLEEKCGKQKITEESDSEIAAIINSWEDTPEVPVEESCEGPECESKEECDGCLKEEKEDESSDDSMAPTYYTLFLDGKVVYKSETIPLDKALSEITTYIKKLTPEQKKSFSLSWQLDESGYYNKPIYDNEGNIVGSRND